MSQDMEWPTDHEGNPLFLIERMVPCAGGGIGIYILSANGSKIRVTVEDDGIGASLKAADGTMKYGGIDWEDIKAQP